MRCHQGIACQQKVGVHAGPAVVLRTLDHRGPYRVEFDMAIDGEQVAFAVDQAGLESTLQQRARPAMPAVERLHLTLPDFADRARQRVALG